MIKENYIMNKNTYNQYYKDNEEIFDELSALFQERDSLLKTLYSITNNKLNKNNIKISTNYDLKINSLLNELKNLQLQLVEKQTLTANKLMILIEDFLVKYQNYEKEWNNIFLIIKQKFNVLKNYKQCEDINDFYSLRDEILDLNNTIEVVLKTNLKPLANNIFIALDNNENILKYLSSFIKKINVDDIYGLIPNKIIIKKIVKSKFNNIFEFLTELNSIFKETYQLEYLFLKHKKDKKIEIIEESINFDNFSNSNAPEFISNNNLDIKEENNKIDNKKHTQSNELLIHDDINFLVGEIKLLRDMLQNKFAEIQKNNLERENKWQIYLDNERNRNHQFLTKFYQNEYKQKKINFDNDFYSIPNENYIEVNKKDSKEFDHDCQKINSNDVSLEVNKMNRFDNYATKHTDLDNIQSHEKSLTTKINQLFDFDKFNKLQTQKIDTELEKAIKLEEDAKKLYFQYDEQKKFLEEKLKDIRNQINIEILANDLTEKITNKFDEEMKKIKNQNLKNIQLNSMNQQLYSSKPINHQQQPLIIDPQFNDTSNMKQNINSKIQPTYNSIMNENFNTNYINDFKTEQSKTIPKVVNKKIKQINEHNVFNGRLSSEDIRKYANSIINLNRLKNENK